MACCGFCKNGIFDEVRQVVRCQVDRITEISCRDSCDGSDTTSCKVACLLLRYEKRS